MRRRRVSPTLGKLSNAFKNFAVEALGKIVGQLICGGDLKHFNVAVANMVPKEVPLNHQEILGPVSDALLGSKQQCSVVVFKDAAANSRLEVRWQSQFLADLTKQVTKGQ